MGVYDDNTKFMLYNPWGVDGAGGATDGIANDGYIMFLNRHDMLVHFSSWSWGE